MKNYRQIQAVNYSKLGSLDRSPLNLLKKEDFESKALDLGACVDTLLFHGKKELDKEISYTELKEPTATLKELIYHCYKNNINGRWAIQGVVDSVNENGDYVYWSSVKKPESRSNKWDTDYFWKYLKYLNDSKGKIKISKDNYDLITNSVEKIKNHEFCKDIFNKKGKAQLAVVQELHGYKYKGLLDWVVFDEKRKIIYPYDLKTSSKYLSAFESSVLFYRYDIQSSLYKHLLEKEFPEYQIADFKMIVYSFVQESVNVFNLKNYYDKARDGYEHNGKYKKGWLQLTEELEWHEKHQLFEHEKSVYENNGEIVL